MRPILLQGHERALTKIKFNSEGDLLFSCSKDPRPSVWFSHNGERLGTFNGHNGTVWSLDISNDSSLLLTGSADNSVKLWEVKTGKMIWSMETETAVRCVAFAMGDKQALIVTDATMGHPSTIQILDINRNYEGEGPIEPTQTFIIEGSKPTVAAFVDLNRQILTGHENGSICIRDSKTGSIGKVVSEQSKAITDLQFDQDKTYFITSSKDSTARIYDLKTLKLVRTYRTDRPVNAASISPLKDHVILGGGQEARDVTTTDTRAGKFEVRFFHRIFEQEIGRVKGHFGPINTVAFHPNGRGYASGGEDGYIRLHEFDKDYFDFDFELEE